MHRNHFIIKALLILHQLLLVHSSSADHENNVPVIGVFTRKIGRTATHWVPPDWYHMQVIPASYIKWLESAGARSIAIDSDATEEQIKEIFKQVNGVLFPGAIGARSDTKKLHNGYSGTNKKAEQLIWELAKQANDEGEVFPIWGTCLGFEWMLEFEADQSNKVVQAAFDSHDVSLPLEFTDYGLQRSRMFQNERHYSDIAQRYNVTYNSHTKGATPDALRADEGVDSMFEIISTNVDANGKEFVSTIEARDYPFYGTQWHPEKIFEYGTHNGTDIPAHPGINHSSEAANLVYKMASIFVEEARKSTHVHTEFERFPIVWSYEILRCGAMEQFFVVRRENETPGDLKSGIRGISME
uniref:folate gamma-glutamyl hydrolase n=1 Tax=Leptocylindrus danicus TaxID=163516 RepID=A0A7S2JXH7_9STRA|mmetsp:Transcript_12235/g.18437  ORF Transcript_12235/g.18437 Transcript_12235/m.18437 type:complete len:356 (+) Transcript_12235:137-1204(+)